MSRPRPRLVPRAQTLVLMALTMLLVVLMGCMTLSISNRVRRRLELQTIADTAAYNNAVSTARGFNTLGILNRTIVSHWVSMLGIEANIAWGSTVPAYFDSFSDTLNEMVWDGPNQCVFANGSIDWSREKPRRQMLFEARNAFNHASLSVWNGAGSAGDDLSIQGCSKAKCFPRLKPGLGQLDREAADQARQVWHSIRDLVEVQRDIQAELKTTLEGQTLASQATLAAQGKPLDGASTFPFSVRLGANAYDAAGKPGTPPGWREVGAALGSTRDALTPLAHAAMGSRGAMFVVNDEHRTGYDDAGVDPNRKWYTPQLAVRYAALITSVMNGRFGANTFDFQVEGSQSSTYLDDGATLDGRPPRTGEFDPLVARRATPRRSTGFEYVTAVENGEIHVVFNSPCGTRKRDRSITAIARTRTNMSVPGRSQHSWQDEKLEIKDDANSVAGYLTDFTKEYLRNGVRPQHAWDLAGHNPAGMCHATHRHWGEADDAIHTLGDEIEGLGLSPGGFGFVFPQAGKSDGASGAFGQPKLPVLLTRVNSAPGLVPDPWNLTLKFSFSTSGQGQQLDLAKSGDTTPVTALATGMAYYHRRCNAYQTARPAENQVKCSSWNESPNLLNPFWRATLVPINVDEQVGVDLTPGGRRADEASTMLDSAGLTDAALTYRLLKSAGYKGIQ